MQENSVVEWKVACTKLMAEYMTPSATVPPPFNLIPSCKSIFKVINLLRWKTGRKQTNGSAQVGFTKLKVPLSVKKSLCEVNATTGKNVTNFKYK